MTIYELAIYVEQDVDDTFDLQVIARWFNKAIANYNLIAPITKFPFVWVDNPLNETPAVDEFETNVDDGTYYANGGEATDNRVGAYTDYPGVDQTFMLAVILPFIASAVRGQESSLTEKQLLMREFTENATRYKAIANIPSTFLFDSTKNTDLAEYQLGENVYISDMRYAPFANEWNKATTYYEVKDNEEE